MTLVTRGRRCSNQSQSDPTIRGSTCKYFMVVPSADQLPRTEQCKLAKAVKVFLLQASTLFERVVSFVRCQMQIVSRVHLRMPQNLVPFFKLNVLKFSVTLKRQQRSLDHTYVMSCSMMCPEGGFHSRRNLPRSTECARRSTNEFGILSCTIEETNSVTVQQSRILFNHLALHK